MGQKIHPTGFRLPVTPQLGRRAGTPATATSPTCWPKTCKVREYLKDAS